MNRFLALTDWVPEKAGGEPDFNAREQLFPEVVSVSHLRLWRPRDPICTTGVRILLGVAVWSGYDMHLLDVVEDALAHSSGPVPCVDVFNVSAATSPDGFTAYIPGLTTPGQPPLVGVWHDGVLTDRASGYFASDLVAKMFGSSADEIVAFVRNRFNDRLAALRAS